MSTAPTGNFSAECPGIIEIDAHRFGRVHVLHYANAPVLTMEETGRYDLAWKDLCSVLNALSK